MYSRRNSEPVGAVEGLIVVQSARRMASLKEELGKEEPEHILPRSLVGVDKIEQISEPPSRLNTTGEQIVALPIEAASSGTGTMYRAFGLES